MRNDLQVAVAHLEAMAQNAIGAAAGADMPNKQRTALWAEYKALDTALTALRDAMQRQPDPDTGLVPCGCGGKAACSDQRLCDHEGKALWSVECSECRIGTDGYTEANEAKAKWNRAMGQKGGAE